MKLNSSMAFTYPYSKLLGARPCGKDPTPQAWVRIGADPNIPVYKNAPRESCGDIGKSCTPQLRFKDGDNDLTIEYVPARANGAGLANTHAVGSNVFIKSQDRINGATIADVPQAQIDEAKKSITYTMSDIEKMGDAIKTLTDVISQKEEKISRAEDQFNNEEDALDKAKEIGCVGTHSMDKDGKTIYMPF